VREVAPHRTMNGRNGAGRLRMNGRQTTTAFASVLAVSLFSRTAYLRAQTSAASLDARASDPVAMGWMVGSPPPAAKLIRYVDRSYYAFPQTRWSYSNIRQFLPTHAVPRGDTTPTALPKAERADMDAVTFQPIGVTKPMTWGGIPASQLHGRHLGIAQRVHCIPAILRCAHADRATHRVFR